MRTPSAPCASSAVAFVVVIVVAIVDVVVLVGMAEHHVPPVVVFVVVSVVGRAGRLTWRGGVGVIIEQRGQGRRKRVGVDDWRGPWLPPRCGRPRGHVFLLSRLLPGEWVFLVYGQCQLGVVCYLVWLRTDQTCKDQTCKGCDGAIVLHKTCNDQAFNHTHIQHLRPGGERV
jgi:hypothetical protein